MILVKTKHSGSFLTNCALILSYPFSWRLVCLLLFISFLTACGGGSSDKSENKTSTSTQNSLAPELKANNYSTRTTAGDAVRIYALDNDIGVHDPSLVVSIASGPTSGTAELQSDNSIIYTPNTGFSGIDTFKYRITLSSGETDTARVRIEVTDSGIKCAYTAGLAWDTTTDTDISGYYIYHGTAPSTYTDKVYVGLVFSHDYCLSTSGDHYFAASSLNIYGRESSLSDEIFINIP